MCAFLTLFADWKSVRPIRRYSTIYQNCEKQNLFITWAIPHCFAWTQGAFGPVFHALHDCTSGFLYGAVLGAPHYPSPHQYTSNLWDLFCRTRLCTDGFYCTGTLHILTEDLLITLSHYPPPPAILSSIFAFFTIYWLLFAFFTLHPSALHGLCLLLLLHIV